MRLFSRSTALAAGLLLATFLVGAAAGGLGVSVLSGDGGRPGPRPSFTDRLLGREPARLSYTDRLARELELTDEQWRAVKTILAHRDEQMRALWQEAQPRIDTLRAQVRAEIMQQLNADQRVRYDSMIRDDERRRAERDRGERGARGDHPPPP